MKSGIRYLRALSDRYNIDTERFGVMGESATSMESLLFGKNVMLNQEEIWQRIISFFKEKL